MGAREGASQLIGRWYRTVSGRDGRFVASSRRLPDERAACALSVIDDLQCHLCVEIGSRRRSPTPDGFVARITKPLVSARIVVANDKSWRQTPASGRPASTLRKA